MNVLVTDLRYRMAFAAVRDLRDAGHTVYGLHFGPEGERTAVSYSEALSGWRTAKDSDGVLRASAATEEASRRRAVILPVGAKTIAALAALPDGPFLVPSEAQLAAANDKSRVLALARDIGIETPAQWDSPAEAVLPAVIKYRNGEALGLHASARYAIVRTHSELEEAWKRMSRLAADGGQAPPLIQEYVTGGGLGVSCLFDRTGRPVSVLCHRRLREYPITGGPSAACEAVWDEGLFSRAVSLLRALSWRGVAMVEFKGTPEHPVLMEINPRVWGSYPLTRVSGCAFSDAWVRAASGEMLPETKGPDYRVGTRMGFRLSNLAAGASYLRHGKIGDCVSAVKDAFSLPDGVFEDGDRTASNAYLRQALRRR